MISSVNKAGRGDYVPAPALFFIYFTISRRKFQPYRKNFSENEKNFPESCRVSSRKKVLRGLSRRIGRAKPPAEGMPYGIGGRFSTNTFILPKTENYRAPRRNRFVPSARRWCPKGHHLRRKAANMDASPHFRTEE